MSIMDLSPFYVVFILIGLGLIVYGRAIIKNRKIESKRYRTSLTVTGEDNNSTSNKMNTVYCHNCGKPIISNGHYCEQCGSMRQDK
ncbi:hypothetical protein LCGC14_2036170 [marine sediment metagenome]|uniref:Zinc-ribbon domain-containing protein n=1 Tax=marine sediment metagenome TaxID=412755 RepID=A0A0F9ET77_9ZZZZ